MSYKTYLVMLSVSAFRLFWLTPFAAWPARRCGAMDLPDKHKVHSRPMPRIGGASVFHADTSHVHPHLLSFGLKHRQASWLLYGVALVTGTSAVLLTTMGIGLQLQFSVLFALLGAAVATLWKFWTRASSTKTEKRVD